MNPPQIDSVGIGIIFGIFACGIPASGRFYRHSTFDAGKSVLEFFAGFAVPVGVSLIHAGFNGSTESLPTHWREHIAIAGVVVFGLSVMTIFRSSKSSWTATPKATPGASDDS